MDRRHRLEGRHTGMQAIPKVPKDNHRREHHRSSKDLDRRVCRDPSRAEAPPDHPAAKLPKGNHEMALSGDKDYVRRWLAQTESDSNHSEAFVTRETSSNKEQNEIAHSEYPARRTALNTAIEPGPSQRKRKHDSSSDSSLLGEPVRPSLHQSKRDDPRPAVSRRSENQSTPPQKKQRVTSSNSRFTSHPPTPSPPKETFEKRARHKTREDRYEPKKKEKKQRKTSDEKTSRKKRERKGDRKKAARTAGETLMQNFSSKSIAQDRLTIRPSQGLGLFNNGRASSPARRRGIPDLAFSEMEFLRQSKTIQHVDTEDKIKSRSREKEKRKASKAQDEISSFFKPNRVPLQDVSSNQSGPPSELARKEHSLYAKQLQSEQDTSNHKPSEPIRSYHEHNGRPSGPSSYRYQAGHSYHCSPKTSHSRNTPGSAGRLSGKATTYVSWSESQRSPTSASLEGNFDRRPGSTTPDSVRRSIDNTGIFRDTGISRDSNFSRATTSPSVCEGQVPKARKTRSVRLSNRTSKETPSFSETGAEIGISEAYIQDREEVQRDGSRRDSRDKLHELPDKITSENQTETIDQHGTIRKRIVVEHFNPRTGWVEAPNAVNLNHQTSAAAMMINNALQSKATPLSREKIAKNARVKMPKRPSTTVPVLRDENVPHDKEQDGRMSIMESSIKSQSNQDSSRASYPQYFANSAHRLLLSRASNPSLPTIYEDSHENSPLHGETPVPERHFGSNVSAEGRGPRLTSIWNNNQNRVESQLEEQSQPNNHMEQEANQSYAGDGANRTYLGFPVRGAWLGNSSGTSSVTRLPTTAGHASLYLRQMQAEALPHHFPHDGTDHAVNELLWVPSGVKPPPYDEDILCGEQQHATYLAEYAHAIDHSNDLEMHQGYERGMDSLDAENFNELGVWNSEAHGVDQSLGNHNMFEDQDYYENRHIYDEQAFSMPHPSAYQDIEYGGYYAQADTNTNRFLQPDRQY
ncbi:hypothetical protein BKA65DRAFT_135273 [Rhexocercosporidium sp. MPI-PUGE-AT-0058]|nr:hypothetical protein BKA65DRAFT_135273 [Rhexocercosporidium sp. MPI-PUGE-AT-0058]